ncbi:hypothetical protein Tco_0987105, partial [Tanacetum coccineum]
VRILKKWTKIKTKADKTEHEIEKSARIQVQRPGYPNFSLDDAFKTSPQPLLSLPAADSATATPQQVLQQTSNATTPTPSEIDPHQMAEDVSKESDTSSPTTKKPTKRELFKDAKTSDKKPRHQD